MIVVGSVTLLVPQMSIAARSSWSSQEDGRHTSGCAGVTLLTPVTWMSSGSPSGSDHRPGTVAGPAPEVAA